MPSGKKPTPYGLHHGFRGNAEMGLGTGPMAPRASARSYARDETQSGTQQFLATSAGANPSLVVPVLIAMWPEASPRVLELGGAYDKWIPGGGLSFPPRGFGSGQSANYYAGWINDAGVRVGNGADQQMACAIELGADAGGGEFYFDWVQGSYNLPSCKYLRVSALPYGAAWAALAGVVLNLRASATAGQLQGAHAPTITGRANLLAATPMTFETPNGLRAVDVEQEDANATAARLELAGAASAVRDYGTGQFLPGWGPVAITPANGAAAAFALSTSLDCFVTLRGYVQL